MREDFVTFVADVEPRLRRALVGCCGVDLAHDATAEALAWAWEHWDRVREMVNPAGYLYRVGRSRVRNRKDPVLPPVEPARMPDVEPGLPLALASLTEKQRAAVWLVHACDFTYGEAAEAMGVSVTAIGTHVSRGMQRLRAALEVRADV